MIVTNSSSSLRGSVRYPVPEPRRVPAGPWLAPAAHCTKTGAARATPLEPPKLSEHGTIFQSSAAKTAAMHSLTSKRHVAKPAPKAEQTSFPGTDAQDQPAPLIIGATALQIGSSPKPIKSTAGRDYWLAGQPTEWMTRYTYTTESSRAQKQPKHDRQSNARLPNLVKATTTAMKTMMPRIMMTMMMIMMTMITMMMMTTTITMIDTNTMMLSKMMITLISRRRRSRTIGEETEAIRTTEATG
jgi:hypothetical protein